MRIAVWALLLGLLVGGIARPGAADELKLKDGTQYEGKVVEETDTAVVFEITNGLVTGRVRFAKDRIASLLRKETARDRALRSFAEQRAALEKRTDAVATGGPADPGLAKAWFDLAHACRADGLDTERSFCLGRVLQVSPDHEFARAELGFVRAGNRWLTAEEAAARREEELRAKGYAKLGGEWLSVEAIAALTELERAKALARASELERKLAESEARLTGLIESAARADAALGQAVDRIGSRVDSLEARLCGLERNEGRQAAAFGAIGADLTNLRREFELLRARLPGLVPGH